MKQVASGPGIDEDANWFGVDEPLQPHWLAHGISRNVKNV